jgi:histidine triad (HIT) family protein
MGDNCIFCKIVNGELSSERIVYEDDSSVAFLDLHPFCRGHTLVVPRAHSRWLWDMGDEEYSEFMLSVKRVADALKRAFDTDCVQVIVAGMEVKHTHVHLLPRKSDDGLSEIPKRPMEAILTSEETSEIVERIKSAL